MRACVVCGHSHSLHSLRAVLVSLVLVERSRVPWAGRGREGGREGGREEGCWERGRTDGCHVPGEGGRKGDRLAQCFRVSDLGQNGLELMAFGIANAIRFRLLRGVLLSALLLPHWIGVSGFCLVIVA